VLPQSKGEPIRLQQILTNLLSNALKYSAPGTPINVTARHHRASPFIFLAPPLRAWHAPEDRRNHCPRMGAGDSA
jgi:hypothetical protein